MRLPAKGGLEQDAFSSWRHVLCYMVNDHRGLKKWIKRKYNKRVRKQARLELRQDDHA